MKMKILTLASIALFFIACNSEQKTSSTSDSTTKMADTAVVDAHNAKNSLDWAGSYTGVVPCADCEGIQTELILNPDMTYVLKTNYMGKDTHFPEDRGTFKWDSSGSKVELIGLKDGPNTYFVGEHTLRQLDMEGKEITGPNADRYLLKKAIQK